MITLGENFAFGFADSGRPHLGQGWSIEPHWSWSTGEAADLALPLPPGEGDLHLELDLTPCVHPPSVPTQRVRILTAGALALERRLAGAAKLHLRVPDPVLPGLVGALPIRFEHPDSVVPREIGLSSDPRRLGICLTRARLLRVPSEPPRLPGPHTLEQDLTFGLTGDGNLLLREGWGAPEHGHVWALGPHSALDIAGATPGADYTLIVELLPFTDPPARPRQRIMAGAGGRLLATFAVSERTAIGLRLPKLAPGDTSWHVTFDNLDAAPPDPTRHAERRPLAFMLLSLRLIRHGPLTGPAPADWVPDPTDTELAQRFESLGCLCDFGHYQRALGIDRATLLHMVLTSTDGLIRGLADGFWGLGRPDTIRVTETADDPNAQLDEMIYWFHTRTPFPKGPDAAPQVLRMAARMFPFLKRQFFESLAANRHILLFRRAHPVLPEELEAVQAALRLHGDPLVLWAAQDGELPPGAVRRLSPRLLQAGLDWNEARTGATHDCWRTVLRRAWQLAAPA